MRILGIWDGHDAGAALLVDGQIVAAVNEERFTRRKLEIRFPTASISSCLAQAGLKPSEIDLVAASTSDVAKALARLVPITKEMYYQVRRRKAPPGAVASLCKRAKYWIPEFAPNAVSRIVSRTCLRRALDRCGFGKARLAIHDHHTCHAFAAARTSGLERCVVVTIDGVGDGLSSTVSVWDHGRLSRLDETAARSSPGIFFEHVTNLLNMRELEDEGKVMALANYAPLPKENPLADLFHGRGLRFSTTVSGHALLARLRAIHWQFPNEQFAAMAQDALERACVSLVREAVRRTGLRNVALAGGVASNVRMNRLVRLLDDVDDVFVFPHMGDGGLALSAALLSAGLEHEPPCADLGDLAFGPSFCDDDIRRSLEAGGVAFEYPATMADRVAELVLQNRVVLWFHGRMEYGPRALGHRSIIARADSIAVRDRLNLVLKRRVWYQPFCPSLLESDARRVFADWKGLPNRHMTMSYQVHDHYRDRLAGAISVDGTCRPQIVDDAGDSDFAALLREMKLRGGLGVVLNTSFNIHGEPLVHTPDQAVDVFLRSGADALAIGGALAVSSDVATPAFEPERDYVVT